MRSKTRQLREISDQELFQKVEELKTELFNLRFQKATGRLENYKRLREVRKEIARALSILRERELGIEPAPPAAEPETRRRRRLFRRRPEVEEEKSEDTTEAVEDEESEGQDAGRAVAEEEVSGSGEAEAGASEDGDTKRDSDKEDDPKDEG